MGNVKTGDMVKANGSGYADPFAWEQPARKSNSTASTERAKTNPIEQPGKK